MKQFCCFGSLNIDYVYHLQHFVQPGETLGCLKRDQNVGGKGLNQSCALAHAGASVYHAGNIGAEGGFLLEALQQHGVKTEFVRTVAQPTGHAIIQVDAAGENSIILFGGANQQTDEKQIDAVLSQFHAGDLLVLQNEINAVSQLMTKAKEKGMQVVLNPSPFDESILTLPLALVDYLFVNEIEGAALTGVSAKQPEQLLLALGQRFPKAEVVLTLGGKGAASILDQKAYWQEAVSAKVVDTTAAGDTFTGFYLTARTEGQSIPQALHLAAAAAAITVSRKGAAQAIPMRSEVLA